MKTYKITYKKQTPSGRKESWIIWREGINAKSVIAEFKKDYPEARNIKIKKQWQQKT